MGMTYPAAERVPRSPWYHPVLAELTHRPWVRPVLMGAALVLGVVADAGVLEPSLEHVLRAAVRTSWLLALTLTLVATAAMASAGWHLRDATGNHPGDKAALIGPSVAVLCWLGLGGTITAVRMTAAQLATGAAFDGAVSTPAPKEVVPAMTFLLLYLLTGTIALVECYNERNDAFTGLLTARKRVAKVTPLLQAAQALQVRLNENYFVRCLDVASLQRAHAVELAGNAALAQELLELSRIEQAIGLGSPITTGTTSVKHPAHPLFDDTAPVSAQASKMTSDNPTSER
jgi:hypothetical protein